MKKLLPLLSILLVSGCSIPNGSFIGIDPDTPDNTLNLVEKKFIGLPVLFAMEGSAVRLNSEWMITAAHNEFFIEEKLIKHPECDIALYRDPLPESEETPIGLLYADQDAFMIGYPPSPFPITSQKGVWLGDYKNLSWEGDCLASAITSTGWGGMSGGGVFNANGQLVGITHAIADGTADWGNGVSHFRPSLFISLLRVKDWLYNHTGIKITGAE